MDFFKKFFYTLDKPIEDENLERIEKEPLFSKYLMLLGLSIFLSILAMLLNFYSMTKREVIEAPIAVAEKPNGEVEQIITIPYAHQSFKNLTSWVKDSITAIYTFDFNNFDKRVADAEYYFTRNGYSTYLNALELSGIKKDVLEKQIIVSIVPVGEPIMINSGMFGDTEFWRFRVPVMIAYLGGKNNINTKYTVEMLVLRVPSHENHKGLGISQLVMAER